MHVDELKMHCMCAFGRGPTHTLAHTLKWVVFASYRWTRVCVCRFAVSVFVCVCVRVWSTLAVVRNVYAQFSVR